MSRFVLALVAVVVLASSAAAATVSWNISGTAIGGAHVGKQKAYYVARFGSGYRVELLENGYRRLTFTKRRLYVYFHTGTAGAVAIVTWNRKYRTPEHVGPCSPADALTTYPTAKKVYSSPGPSGNRSTVYRLGQLLFRVERRRVVTVGLGTARRAVFLTTTAPGCS
jgi:hypothetical protein